MQIAAEHVSEWNQRFVIRLADASEIEAVLYRGDTLCISSQVGCAVGCPFCASGARGFGRNLDLDELEGQLELVRALGHSISGITVSGIGEPLHNGARVATLIRNCASKGIRSTLTTSGGPCSRLGEFLRDVPHRGLTLSVHAGSEAVRARAVPHGPSLADLWQELARVVPTLSEKRRKKTALAYLMISGLNDSADELDAFAERARSVALRVHLYAYNPVAHAEFSAVSREEYEAAYHRLRQHGLNVRMSSKARLSANGGCGTLVALRRERGSSGSPHVFSGDPSSGAA